MTKSNPVLVVEADIRTRRLLSLCLERAGYGVVEAATGYEGIGEAVRRQPQAVLLDTDLPDMDGLEVLKRLREWSQIPILIISASEDEERKINALDGGANDYVLKPFSPGELLARLRAAQRSVQPLPQPNVFRAGGLSVDLASRKVQVMGQTIKLTATEYSLLHLFVRHAGKVLTHEHILREIWGPRELNNLGYLRVYLAYLRKKLRAASSGTELFVTEPGVGYRLSLH